MIVYPAMDLMNGRCVRLEQGRFDRATGYAAKPAAALAALAAEGARWAHVVDLDGARAGAPRQHDLVAALAAAAPLSLQVAGGIRTVDQAERLLQAGASRIVVGSLAVKQPETVATMLHSFGPDRVTLALDVRIAGGTPMVVTHGWAEQSALTLWQVADTFGDARHLLLTDVDRDGMLTGPNVDLVAEAARRLPDWSVQASGGVARLDDLPSLAAAGAGGVIIGKALWEGRFTLKAALAHAGV